MPKLLVRYHLAKGPAGYCLLYGLLHCAERIAYNMTKSGSVEINKLIISRRSSVTSWKCISNTELWLTIAASLIVYTLLPRASRWTRWKGQISSGGLILLRYDSQYARSFCLRLDTSVLSYGIILQAINMSYGVCQ